MTDKRIVFCRLGTCCIALAMLCGCRSSSVENVKDDRLSAFVGISPLAYLVEQIGGPHVKVDVLVQPNQDPHTFEPTPQQIFAINKATVFFKIDMPFEGVLLRKVQDSNPTLRIVDTTEGIKKRQLEHGCCVVSPADGHAEHAHEREAGEPDPHVWLSPQCLKIQAGNIAKALCEIDPQHRQEYEKNLAALSQRLDDLEKRLASQLKPYRDHTFYVFHPGFGYFADAFGLKEVAVEVGGKSPSPKELRELIEQVKRNRIKTIFIQPQSNPQSAQVIADAIGGRVVTINGLAKDVLNDMEDIANKIEAAMKESLEQHGSKSPRPLGKG
jgi:zinc transport system substrate-binding protein